MLHANETSCRVRVEEVNQRVGGVEVVLVEEWSNGSMPCDLVLFNVLSEDDRQQSCCVSFRCCNIIQECHNVTTQESEDLSPSTRKHLLTLRCFGHFCSPAKQFTRFVMKLLTPDHRYLVACSPVIAIQRLEGFPQPKCKPQIFDQPCAQLDWKAVKVTQGGVRKKVPLMRKGLSGRALNGGCALRAGCCDELWESALKVYVYDLSAPSKKVLCPYQVEIESISRVLPASPLMYPSFNKLDIPAMKYSSPSLSIVREDKEPYPLLGNFNSSWLDNPMELEETLPIESLSTSLSVTMDDYESSPPIIDNMERIQTCSTISSTLEDQEVIMVDREGTSLPFSSSKEDHGPESNYHSTLINYHCLNTSTVIAQRSFI